MDVHLGKAESEERRVYILLLIKIILSACCRCVEEEEKLCLGLVHHPGNALEQCLGVEGQEYYIF